MLDLFAKSPIEACSAALTALQHLVGFLPAHAAIQLEPGIGLGRATKSILKCRGSEGLDKTVVVVDLIYWRWVIYFKKQY